jgi:hypothetical protein
VNDKLQIKLKKIYFSGDEEKTSADPSAFSQPTRTAAADAAEKATKELEKKWPGDSEMH